MAAFFNRDELLTNPTLLLRLKGDDPTPRQLAWEEFQRRYAPIIAGFAMKLGVKAILKAKWHWAGLFLIAQQTTPAVKLPEKFLRDQFRRFAGL